MKKILLLCLVLGFTTGCVKGTGENFLNKPSPDPLVYPMRGDAQRLSAYSGKQVALLFWSTQCSKSMGELRDFAKEFAKNKALRDVVGIAINIDSQDREEKVLEVINSLPKSHLTFSYSANDIYDEAYQLFDVSVVPQFFAIDANGVVRAEGLDASDLTSYFD